jgi:radical SAM protein with 4Fe4S-binding SPASM domain
MTALGVCNAPQYVLWEITRACNLRCRHCLSSSGAAAPDELDGSEALALCDALGDLGVPAVALLGGEPLVRADWAAIASRLVERRVAVGLVTNGLLFDRAVAERARDIGVGQIVVSLDGLEPTHDALRGRGSFGKAVDALCLAGDLGFRHRMVVTSVHRGNLEDVPRMVEIMRACARGAQWALNLTSIRPGQRMPATNHLDGAGFLRLVGFIADARRRLEGDVEVVGAHDVGYLSLRTPDVQGVPWAGCRAGLSTLGITARGEVKGCLALPDDWVEGRLRSGSIAALWRSPHAFSRLRRFDPSMLGPRCQGCDHGASCRGGCTELSLTMSGQPHAAPFCLHRWESAGGP